SLSTIYETYYNACQPIKYTYSYATTTDLLYILTTLFGLVGGMMTILKLVVPLFVKIVRRNKSVPTETTYLLLSLHTIRDTNQANDLWSIAGVQYSLYKQINYDSLLLIIRDYFCCNSDYSAKCIRQSSIYRYSHGSLLYSILSLHLGC
ncbi:unnamed protein product, partial [Rotaria sp. Silwood2]